MTTFQTQKGLLGEEFPKRLACFFTIKAHLLVQKEKKIKVPKALQLIACKKENKDKNR